MLALGLCAAAAGRRATAFRFAFILVVIVAAAPLEGLGTAVSPGPHRASPSAAMSCRTRGGRKSPSLPWQLLGRRRTFVAALNIKIQHNEVTARGSNQGEYSTQRWLVHPRCAPVAARCRTIWPQHPNLLQL